jgi:hypothetical protein
MRVVQIAKLTETADTVMTESPFAYGTYEIVTSHRSGLMYLSN